MIKATDVKKLREVTGASIMAIKRALESAQGDFTKAQEFLASHGEDVVKSKASRQTRSGVVDAYIHNGAKTGAIVELFCETDFVAMSEEFKTLAHDIAMQIVVADPQDEKELLGSSFIKDESETIKEHVDKKIALLGENINIGKFSRLEL